jgi:hypothetical protein
MFGTFMGLTMQPCRELHYFVEGLIFIFFDFMYVLNI